MSASPGDTERKVRELDNDVQAIYEMLSRIEATQRRHDSRFAEIGDDIRDLRGQVTALDGKVTSLDDKVTSLDKKVTSLDTKLDRVIGLLEG